MATTYFGIDCAAWQGTIDWAKVKKAGVQFAILKVTQKNNTVEKAFERNYAGCIAQNIPMGVYRYVYAKTPAEATAEAKAIVSILKGKKITCGVWLDMEDSSIRSIGKSALNAVIAAERKVLEAAGYQVGIYCNQSWYNSVLDVDKLDLPFWIAKYGTNNGKQQSKPVVKSKHTLWGWQYSSVGKVSGISGAVDVNVAYQSPSTVTGGAAATLLRKGDRGEAVKLLQQRLTICGWILTADGIWGDKTDSAVRAYQYKAGLTVDGIVGPKTQAKLIQDAIVTRAKEIASYMVKNKWHYKGDGYTAKSTFAATKKLDKPGSSCAHFVSWVLQDVELLKAGKVLSHTKAGYGTGAKSIVNADQLIGCAVTYPNLKLANYKDKLQPGDVLVHDSSIGIYLLDGGKPAVITGRNGQTVNDKNQYIKLTVTSGYEWKHDILALVRAKV